MIYNTKHEFLDNIFKNNIAGFDVSKKNIGLAVCNLETGVISPSSIIKREKFADDILRIKIFIAEYNIGGIVIGLPLNMDGSESKNTQSVRQFARNIMKDFDIPAIFQDERLTTFASKEIMFSSGAGTKKITDGNDAMAAAVILNDFMRI